MVSSIWHRLVMLLALQQVVASPTVGASFRATKTWSLLGARDDGDEYEVGDLSFITKMAAIGDSYSAGIGSGNLLGSFFSDPTASGDWSCRRSDHAYPYLIHNDVRLGDDSSKRNFQFKSCSSAVTSDVVQKQIPNIDGDQQAILLSVGGNDAGLEDILNHCIFQWASFNQEQATVAKLEEIREKMMKEATKSEWIESVDWDKLSRGCDGQLEFTNSVINSDDFSKSIDSVLEAAKAKLSSDGMIYYTGYTKFFAEDMSPACDRVTWSTFVHKSYNVFLDAAPLTTDKRKKMNDLVDAVNKKLEEAVSRAGPQVRFVNYDKWVGELGGRYCEAGVEESSITEENTNQNLMFYELNIFDPWANNPYKRSTEESPGEAFDGMANAWAQITMEVDPATEFSQQQLVDDANSGDMTVTSFSIGEIEDAVKEKMSNLVPNLLPVGYGRVFHPQVKLHSLIANMVIWAMIDANSQKHGDEAIPEIATATESACPVRATVGNDLTCKTASDCPGAALCRFLFSTIACTDGKCGCAAPPPATTTISNKNLPTATPETMTRLIGWDQAWGLVTWPQCKDVSDLLSGFKIQGQMAQDCHFQVNYKSVQCVMADVSPGQVMCLYTSSDCTGDKYVEFKEGDHNIKWIGGDNGNSPEGMNSWEVKANSCR